MAKREEIKHYNLDGCCGGCSPCFSISRDGGGPCEGWPCVTVLNEMLNTVEVKKENG